MQILIIVPKMKEEHYEKNNPIHNCVVLLYNCNCKYINVKIINNIVSDNKSAVRVVWS